ncbi:MAG: hypothetical protein WC548_00530 [Candidatus Pacearchaeota archaeon]
MKNKNYIYKKEKKIFWSGMALGIGGGILGSLFSSLFIEILTNQIVDSILKEKILWIIFVVVAFGLMWILYKINKNLGTLSRK